MDESAFCKQVTSILAPRENELKNGSVLVIREAAVADAGALLEYVDGVSGESDFLSFGPGEFGLEEAEEAEYLGRCLATDNQLYLLGLIEGEIVAGLHFEAGKRPRVRHAGEFGMSVSKQHWGLGIGSLLLDALIDWARGTGIVTKINLRVRTDNRRAMLLYERKGFVFEGTIRKEMHLNGKYYDHHIMGLEV